MNKEDHVKVCIVGAGKVGKSLAAQLSDSGYKVTVIDTSLEQVNNISNSYDVICYQGNGASTEVLEDAGVASAEIFIAVTGSDELNILSCLTAHELGAKSTIARIRNAEYSVQSDFYTERFGLTLIFNPDYNAASEIMRLMHLPIATKVELFAHGKCQLVEMKVEEGNSLIGSNLIDFSQKHNIDLLICAIVRKGQIMIPTAQDVIQLGDVLCLTGSPASFNDAFLKMNIKTKRIKSVMIAGASRIARYLASALVKEHVKVTLIERDHTKAVKIADEVPGLSVMCSDAMSYFESMSDSDVKNTDALITLTNNDEYNLICGMLGERKNIYRIVTKLNADSTLNEMCHNTRISSVSKEDCAADMIMSYAKSVVAAEDYDAIRALYRLMNGKLEFIEFKLSLDIDPAVETYINKPIRNLKIKPEFLIAGIIRDRASIMPRGNDEILPGDYVIVCTVSKSILQLKDIFEETKA